MCKTDPDIFGININVVIKTIDVSSYNEEQRLSMDEFDLLCSINHPNIMKAYFKWGPAENKLNFAFEYFPCLDLAQLIQEYKNE